MAILSKRVLVTGGGGFIASHVVDRLSALGHEVTVFDDLSTGDRANVASGIHLVEGSINDADVLNRLFREFSPQWVSHHAAQVSVAQSAENPLHDANVNVLGSIQLLEACRRHGIEHLTFSSTGGALYGNPDTVPCDEDTVVRPTSPYGGAKSAVEGYLRVYRATWGIKSVALRYANVYGPRQSPHGEAGVVAIFAGKMLAQEQPILFGTGGQQRDFIYVADVVEANLLAMEQQLEGAYNVGTGIGSSVNQVVEALRRACGYTGPLARLPERPGEVQRIALDATRFTQATGWRPKTSLEEGIQQTVDSLRAAN